MWEFEKYRRLLKKKQPPGRRLEVEAAAALASLEQEEGETARKLELNHDALIQQSRVLWRMIAELEDRSQRPVRWMLQVRRTRPTEQAPGMARAARGGGFRVFRGACSSARQTQTPSARCPCPALVGWRTWPTAVEASCSGRASAALPSYQSVGMEPEVSRSSQR